MITDIVKPLEKLIEVVSSGIGIMYKPRAIRKEAEAKAYEIEIVERAKSKALAERLEVRYETLEKIEERIIHKEVKRQRNIDNVVQIATEQLNYEKTVSSEPVDKDWNTRFFNIIEDISDEDMQLLWGRILAGEIKQPKSYSLRTIETLKNISKQEAELFVRFSQLRLVGNNNNFVYNPEDGVFLEKEFNINFKDRLLLSELGLIASESNISFGFEPVNQPNVINMITYGNIGVFLRRNVGTPAQGIEVLTFTRIGLELSKLIQQESNEKYLTKICSGFKHPSVQIEYGNFVIYPDGRFHLLNGQIYTG